LLNMTIRPLDLAIIGAGPAGSAAAIVAARTGARVALLEARSFPRHKVCGEFVSAEALDVLSDLLGSEHALLRTAPEIVQTRLWLGSRVIEAPLAPAARSITRYDLDLGLWEAAKAAGVDCREQAEITAIEAGTPFRLRTATGDVNARAVIVASGRWSQFTADRTVPPGPKWIGVKAHFREASPSVSTDLYFFERGYCGVQPVAPGIVNACAMVRADRAGSLEQVLRLHPALAERAAKWQMVSEPVTTAPLLYRRYQPVRESTLFVGDAAAFIDPFVGDGISIALRSGRLAAACLSGCLSNTGTLEDAAANYEQAYEQEFVLLLTSAARVRGLLSMNAWAQMVAFEALRLPGLLPLIIRKTRRAS
jgi:flavin-dependent dehydrogenase